MTVKSLQK